MDLYQDRLCQENWASDPEQEKAVGSLQRLLNDFDKKQSLFGRKTQSAGVYLYGGVGRGKSMLMDMFFSLVPEKVKKRRIHFHEFMIETQAWLHQKRGDKVDDLLPRYAAYLSKQMRVLCFDEFHVTDVADAMILGRLFTALFEEGVVVVATSNWAPDHLYEDGLQRDLFLPFIELLKNHLDIVYLDSDRDYRQRLEESQEKYYFSPLNAQTFQRIDRLFDNLTQGYKRGEDTISVKGRIISVQCTANSIARFGFGELCEQPLAAEDYLAIANRYKMLFLENVPRLGYDRRNETKRLIILIDCLYECRRRLVISAEKSIEEIYEGEDHAFEFERTLSRLQEMQSEDYAPAL